SDQEIAAVVAGEKVVSASSVELVPSRAPGKGVVVVPAEDDVMATPAPERVVVGLAVDHVRPGAADERVLPVPRAQLGGTGEARGVEVDSLVARERHGRALD